MGIFAKTYGEVTTKEKYYEMMKEIKNLFGMKRSRTRVVEPVTFDKVIFQENIAKYCECTRPKYLQCTDESNTKIFFFNSN